MYTCVTTSSIGLMRSSHMLKIKIDDIRLHLEVFIVDDKFLKTIYCIEYICKLNEFRMNKNYI